MKVLVIGSVYPRFDKDAEVPWLRTSVAHLKKAGVEIQVLAPSYKGLKSHDIDGTRVSGSGRGSFSRFSGSERLR